jgi:nucleotide-binding universal stress UspA family protein
VSVIRSTTKIEGRANTKVLLATDGSEFSDRAAQSLAERPWPAGTEVRILSAVELILPSTGALLEPPFTDSAFIESLRTDATKRSHHAIAHARQILSSTTLNVSESMSDLPHTPKAIILDEAARWGANLIVLGSHGHRGLDRFLLGSVSDAVAMHAACSVEVIRKAA